MNKALVKRFFSLSLLCVTGAFAREIRTPLPLPLTGVAHYPYMDKTSCRCECKEKKCCGWDVDFTVYGAAYSRSADKAYVCGDKNTTHKVPWSTLLFGKSDFSVAEAFPGGQVGVFTQNPFVAIATLTPRYDYNEHGAIFGAILGTSSCWCGKTYNMGLRAQMPVRDIEVKAITAGPGGNNMVGETLNDVYRTRLENHGTMPDAKTVTASATRLDFLNQLRRISPSGAMMIQGWTAPMTIAEQNVTRPAVLTNGYPSMALLYRASGVIPGTAPWAAYEAAANTALAADGSGVSEAQRGYFVLATDYSPLGANSVAQSKLFLVPTITNDAAGGNVLSDGAQAVQAAIDSAVGGLGVTSVADFFVEKGVNIWDGRTKGLGDLDVDLYLNRYWGCEDQWFTELFLGMRFPTAKKLCDCRYILKQPLGNNGHFEGRIGGQLGWDVCDLLKFKIDGAFSWAFKRCEQIAAPFKGATIKNLLGPCVSADISWHYFLGNATAIFAVSDNCGLDIGYQLYAKSCDKVCLCRQTATDYVGRPNQLLDPAPAKLLTKVMAHKARVEMYTTCCCCEIFGGFDYTFAGKNAPRDMDLFAGMMVKF